jgi:hypothetical protein
VGCTKRLRLIEPENRFLNQDEFETLRKQCIEKLSKLVFTDYLNDTHFLSLCFELNAWGENEILTEIRKQISALPDSLLHFAELSLSLVRSTGAKSRYNAFRMENFKFLTNNDDWTEGELITALKPFAKKESDRYELIMTAIHDTKY